MDGLGPRGVPMPDMHHRGQSHEALKAMTDAGQPAVSEEIADRWRAMGAGLEDAGIALQQAVIGSEGGWTGQAADAMRYRLGQVAEWSMKAGESFTAASAAVREQSGAVGEAKTRMPEPVPYDPQRIFDQAASEGLLGIMALPQRMYAEKQKSDAAYNQAVVVVAARDGQLAKGAATIPAFGPPPALNDDGGGAPDDGRSREPVGGRGTGVERGFFGGPGVGGGPTVGDGGPGSADDGTRSTAPAPTTTGPGPQLTNQDRYRPAPPSGARDVPVGGSGPGTGMPGDGAAFVPGMGFPPGVGLGSGAGRGAGGGPARGFGSGGGAPGAGGGPGGGGAPGRGPGAATGLGPGAAAAAEAAGGRGAAGARGGAGMAGMPLGAGRGRGEEDTEHQRPSYLQEDDPESLFGSDQATAPPVIGGPDED